MSVDVGKDINYTTGNLSLVVFVVASSSTQLNLGRLKFLTMAKSSEMLVNCCISVISADSSSFFFWGACQSKLRMQSTYLGELSER